MSLYAQLKTAKSEEDVKDAYIKALGLKGYTKGLIDIRTNEIWFEAKDTGKYSSYAMFTQLLHYVQDALNKGETVPPFLAVIDTEKAALMKSTDVLPFLSKKTVKWGKSASQYTQEALDEISAYIGTHFVSFKISTHEDEFISTVKAAIKSGDIIRTQITPDNLKQVFDKWVEMIGREIVGVDEEKYALLFFADIMHDGTVSTHANPRNIYMSTLDEADVDVMKATKTCVAAQRFQYDYLNDDITDDGRINYNLSNKVPAGLRKAIAEGKKILVLINPPYAEAANSAGSEGKTDVANTRMAKCMDEYGYLYCNSNDLQHAGQQTALFSSVYNGGNGFYVVPNTDVRTVRDELKLNRPDVGWYQIRNALKARNASGDTAPVDFTPFEIAYKELSDKLRPQVFELGFLR